MEKPPVLSDEDVIIPPKSKRRLRVFTEPLVRELIQQACQDTAREIFEDMGNIFAPDPPAGTFMDSPKRAWEDGFYSCKDKALSLKSKITRRLTIARVV